MPGTASISGIVSGMNTDEIIAKLMELERVPVTRLEARKARLTSKLTAWQDMNTRILALKAKADALANPLTFQAKSFSSTDNSILTGSASSAAQVGTYYLKVNALAKTHQQKSQGYADINSTTVGSGTISVKVGSGTPTEITIDSANNTLQGVRDAINRAGAGVTATIINDGDPASPYRLVVTSNTGGTAGQVEITVGEGLSLTFSDLQPAANASVTLGEGAGAITVTKGTNTITDLIPGVTLNLNSVDAAKTVTVTVTPNTAAVKQSITEFVEQFNNLVDFINAQSAFDTKTNTAATLFGESRVRNILSDLRSRVSNPITGLSQHIKLLSQIGITSTLGDKLVIDSTKLDEALAGGIDDVKRLFARLGETTSASVSYVSSTAQTKTSGAEGYAVSITAAAAQAWVRTGVAQTGALAVDETLVINGVSIDLTVGMNQSEVISKINEYSTQTGVVASAMESGGQNYLALTRIGYGTSQHISVQSDIAPAYGSPELTSGFGASLVTETDPDGEYGTGDGEAGADVQGTINGEPATGSGQFLTGNTGNANTEGLKIKVTATVPGDYGTIAFTRGVAGLLADYSSFVTQANTGALASARDTLQDQIDFIDKEIADMELRLAAREERLMNQFSAMENALSRLQSQGTFLAQQIVQIQANWG